MKYQNIAASCLLIVNCLVVGVACANSSGATRQSGVVVVAPNGACVASLRTSTQGGFLQLYIGRDQAHLVHVADDITGIAWATATTLVFSASPIYGTPGIFLVGCRDPHGVTTVAAPKNIDKAYPKGADYFELRSVVDNEIKYFYGDDVDKIDFSQFHSTGNEREVQLPKL